MKYKITVRKEGLADETRVVHAASRFEVYSQIRGEGGFVTSLEEKPEASLGSLSQFNISIGTGIKRMEIVHMAKNLSAMLSAGLSVSRSLSIIERQSSNKYMKKI